MRKEVFNGDTDPCVSYEGTRTAIENVGFPVLSGGHYRPWFYNKSAATLKTLLEKPNLFGPNLELRNAGPQYGGHVVNYDHGLSFATVHGSGHMVPQFRPQAAERGFVGDLKRFQFIRNDKEASLKKILCRIKMNKV